MRCHYTQAEQRDDGWRAQRARLLLHPVRTMANGRSASTARASQRSNALAKTVDVRRLYCSGTQSGDEDETWRHVQFFLGKWENSVNAKMQRPPEYDPSTPPEFPGRPAPEPEIEPQPPAPEIPEPPDQMPPEQPTGPEIQPEPTPPEYPV